MEINDEAKQIVQDIAAAINSAVERSPDVADGIERLRRAGYIMEITLRLEIGLREIERPSPEAEAESWATELELTDEDRMTLRRMKIKIDDAE